MAVVRGQGRNAYVDRLCAVVKVDSAILWPALFGDVDARHYLESGIDFGYGTLWQLARDGQDAVLAESDQEVLFSGFEVYVRNARVHGFGNDFVYQTDDGRVDADSGGVLVKRRHRAFGKSVDPLHYLIFFRFYRDDAYSRADLDVVYQIEIVDIGHGNFQLPGGLVVFDGEGCITAHLFLRKEPECCLRWCAGKFERHKLLARICLCGIGRDEEYADGSENEV